MAPVFVCLLMLSSLSAQQPSNAGETNHNEWHVSGVVRTEAGPVARVFVSIRGPENRILPVQTDSAGRYRFGGTVPGTYTVRVQKPDDAGEPRPRTLILIPGKRIDDLDFFAAKGASISGTITDRSSRPVAGVPVIAYARWHAYGRLRLAQKGVSLTDENGSYRISHLPDGTYLIAADHTIKSPLRATKRDPALPDVLPQTYPPVTFSPGGRNVLGAAQVAAQNGIEISNINIVMDKEPSYCIFFRPSVIPLQSDQPPKLSAMLIEWAGAKGPKAGGGTLLPGSDAQFCGVPAGEYMLGLAAYSGSPMKGLGFGSMTFAVSGRHIDLGTLEAVGQLDLRGRITPAAATVTPTLPEGIRISLSLLNRDLLPSDVLQGKVQSDGSFELSKVYQDTYGLTVENLPRGYYVASARQGGLDVTEAGVRPGSIPVEIEVASGGPSLSGRILSPGKAPKPVPQAIVVLLSDQDNIVQSTQSDQDGHYDFLAGLPPGEYRVVALSDVAEPSFWTPQMSAQYDSRIVKVRLLPFDRKTMDLVAAQPH